MGERIGNALTYLVIGASIVAFAWVWGNNPCWYDWHTQWSPDARYNRDALKEQADE